MNRTFYQQQSCEINEEQLFLGLFKEDCISLVQTPSLPPCEYLSCESLLNLGDKRDYAEKGCPQLCNDDRGASISLFAGRAVLKSRESEFPVTALVLAQSAGEISSPGRQSACSVTAPPPTASLNGALIITV